MHTLPTPTPTDVDYPDAPWHMNGQLWLSLFRVREGDHPDRRSGFYGVALVAYEEPSPLTYSELLVATNHDDAVTISDIWVDSLASVAGGRELWAIPKALATLERRADPRRLYDRTRWTVTIDGQPVVSAWFADVARHAPRVPFKGGTWQRRDDGTEVTASLTGSAKAMPCRGSWSFAADGPLGWLHGKRPLVTFRMVDFQMSFG